MTLPVPESMDAGVKEEDGDYVKDGPGGDVDKEGDVKESLGGGATKEIDGEVDRLGDILRDLGLEMTQVFESGEKPTGEDKSEEGLDIKIAGERRHERAGTVSIASDENEFDIMEGELEQISSSILDSTLESSLALEVSDSSHGSYTLDNSDIQDIDSPTGHYGAANKTI